jgi:hypothetical protein
MGLAIWKTTVAKKRGELTGQLDYSIPEKLKHEELTLKRETAPLLPSPITGISEFAAANPEQDAQTLLAAAASMISQLDKGTFSSPQIFKDKITALRNDPNLREDTGRLLNYMAELEQGLRDTKDVIVLTDETNYPLFIWYAVANYDISKTDEELVPILGEAESDSTEK